MIVHLLQKLRRERKSRRRAEDRINAAARTNCCCANSVALVNPVLDLRRREILATIKAAAHIASKDLITMIDRMFVRRFEVRLVAWG